MKHWLAILSLLLLLAAGVTGAPAAGLEQVSFIPQWSPQSQFAGYYVAHDKGFYRQFGLEVKILRGGPDWPPSELLAAGRADFGTMFLTSGISKRSQGVKLVNIAQIVQRSALMLVAKKTSGIHTPQDINGKKVGLWGDDFQGQPRAFFRKYGLRVKVVPQSNTLNLFLRGGTDVASAMWYNEYHLILNAGYNPDELTTFLLADYDLSFPEDGIYCLEQTLKRRPEVCRRFVQASLAGWQYALANPEETLDIVMRYVDAANVPTARGHQKWMLARMGDIILPPGTTKLMGTLEESSYRRVAQEMQQNGLIKNIPDFANFYVNCGSPHEK